MDHDAVETLCKYHQSENFPLLKIDLNFADAKTIFQELEVFAIALCSEIWYGVSTLLNLQMGLEQFGRRSSRILQKGGFHNACSEN